MFNRKVLVIALLAVVFLTSFMDAQVGIDGAYMRKRRVKKIAETISVTVPAMVQANLESLMDQAAGQDTLQASGRIRRHPRTRKTAFESGGLNQVSYGTSATDEDTLQASGRIRRHPRTRKTALESGGLNQVSYASATDEDTLQASGRIRKEPRKRRII